MATANRPRTFHHHRPLNGGPPTPPELLAASRNGDAPVSAGRPAAEISNAVVGLLRDHAGRGPTKAKTVLTADLAVVTLYGCLTRAELTLSERGDHALVRSVRHALHEAIRPEAEATVASITGRPVVASRIRIEGEPEHAVLTFSLGGTGAESNGARPASGSAATGAPYPR